VRTGRREVPALVSEPFVAAQRSHFGPFDLVGASETSIQRKATSPTRLIAKKNDRRFRGVLIPRGVRID
jgi:hypothetical protein